MTRNPASSLRRQLLGWLLAGYAVARIGVEFFREPDAQIGFISGATMGQLLSVPMLLAGIGLIAWARRRALAQAGPAREAG